MEAACAKIAGGDLCIVVAAPLVRNPDVQKHDVHDIVLQHALAEELDDRNAQTLLIDFGHAAGHGTRHHAADIGVVCDVADKGNKLALDKNRLGVVDVGQMRTARRVRIVGDEDIAFLNVVAEFFKHAAHQAAHRSDMDRQRQGRLDNQPAVFVDDCDGVILALLDVGRIGRTHQGDKTLVRDRAQAIGDNLKPDRIELLGFGAHASVSALILMIRCPSGVTSARSPG